MDMESPINMPVELVKDILETYSQINKRLFTEHTKLCGKIYNEFEWMKYEEIIKIKQRITSIRSEIKNNWLFQIHMVQLHDDIYYFTHLSQEIYFLKPCLDTLI